MKTIMNTMIKRTMKHINKQGKQYGDINNQQQGLFKRKRKFRFIKNKARCVIIFHSKLLSVKR